MSFRISLAVFSSRDDDLVNYLGDRGVAVEEYPLVNRIAVHEYDGRLCSRWVKLISDDTGYLLFTSKKAVERFQEIIVSVPASQKPIDFTRIISVGPSTSAHLEKIGLLPQYRVVGNHEGQRGIWNIIESKRLNPIVHIRPVVIDRYLEERLREHGYTYEPFLVYQTEPLKLTNKMKRGVLASDYLFFSSGSIVEAFYDNFMDYQPIPPVILIGESTRKSYEKFFSMREGDRVLQGRYGDSLGTRILKTLEMVRRKIVSPEENRE